MSVVDVGEFSAIAEKFVPVMLEKNLIQRAKKSIQKRQKAVKLTSISKSDIVKIITVRKIPRLIILLHH